MDSMITLGIGKMELDQGKINMCNDHSCLFQKEDIFPKLITQEKILIVTEGSSDTDIIKKCINLLYSDIADFFNFIDMDQNYPYYNYRNE